MRTSFVCLVFIVVIPLSAVAQSASDLATPQKRAVSLDLIRTLLTTTPTGDSAEEIVKKNPFSPKQSVVPVDSTAVAALSQLGLGDRELLLRLADGVNPSGTMQLGDTLILLFGQKKFKVGDVIPIVFEEATHELQVTSIERTSFTLRLKSEEITRPIKPVVNKP